MYVRGVLFFCLFIYFTCESVWSILVNQKGFLYITSRKLTAAETNNSNIEKEKLASVGHIKAAKLIRQKFFIKVGPQTVKIHI